MSECLHTNVAHTKEKQDDLERGICLDCGEDVSRVFFASDPSTLTAELFGEPGPDGWTPWTPQP